MPFGWTVEMYYDARPKDAEIIIDRLLATGCSERHLHKASRLLRSGVPNQGLTFSDSGRHRSVIVISRVTDFFELCNTLSHECQHLEQAVCREFKLDPYGEDIAYISGEISEAIARNAWFSMRKIFLYLI